MPSDETPYAPPKTEITEEYANRGSNETYDLPRSPLTLKGIGLLFFKPKAFFSGEANARFTLHANGRPV